MKIGGALKSLVIKRSVFVNGHKTSVSIEEAFWSALKEIAVGRDMAISQLVTEIDVNRQQRNVSSAIRLFVLDHYRSQQPHDIAQQPFRGVICFRRPHDRRRRHAVGVAQFLGLRLAASQKACQIIGKSYSRLRKRFLVDQDRVVSAVLP